MVPTSMNKLRAWNLLADKARVAADEAFAVVTAKRQTLAELQLREERLRELHQDYRQNLLQVQSETHAMGQNANFRRYLAHIETLQGKLSDCRVEVERDLSTAWQAYQQAFLEVSKMEKMGELEQGRLDRERKKKEARQMDAMATLQFKHR